MAFSFEGERIEAGTARWVDLPVAEDADASDLSIPVHVVHGGDGPVVWMQGAVHGPEHVGSLALRDYALELPPEDVEGTVVAAPVVNRSAFASKQRASPIDGKDLNRSFPGDPEGTFTDRLAARVYSTVAEHADYAVDLHTGGNQFLIPGYCIFAPTGDDVERASRGMCEAAGLPYAVGAARDVFPDAIYTELAREGIPTIVVEVGGEGRIREEHLERAARAVRNVPRHLGVVDGAVDVDTEVDFSEELTVMRADHGGFFECEVEPNVPVEAGQHLAAVTDIRGDTKGTFEAPYDAVPVAVQTYGIVRPGDWTFELLPR